MERVDKQKQSQNKFGIMCEIINDMPYRHHDDKKKLQIIP